MEGRGERKKGEERVVVTRLGYTSSGGEEEEEGKEEKRDRGERGAKRKRKSNKNWIHKA